MIALKTIKRLIVMMVGATVLALGVALLVLPGPAFIVIPAGLGILAIEFAWAKRWLRKAREWLPGKSDRGSTGDRLALSGDSPGGTGSPSVTKKIAFGAAKVPVGESPALPVCRTPPQPRPSLP